MCACLCVYSLTPGWPPLLGLHGQRAHHSPHVCRRRCGNKCVCVLKSVSLRHVFQRLERTRTHSLALFPPLILSSSLSTSSLNGCSRQKPSFHHPLFHPFTLHLMVLLLSFSLSLSPLSPQTPSLPPSPPSFPPCSLFFIRGCSCPPSFHFSSSLSLHPSPSHPHSEARAREEHQ